jgi:hypothetical protein
MVKPVVNPNMNKTFREVVGRFVGAPPQLSHKQTVQRLYKKSLKTLDSWIIDRRLWNEEATKIRAEFDANAKMDPESGWVQSSQAGKVPTIGRFDAFRWSLILHILLLVAVWPSAWCARRRTRWTTTRTRTAIYSTSTWQTHNTSWRRR